MAAGEVFFTRRRLQTDSNKRIALAGACEGKVRGRISQTPPASPRVPMIGSIATYIRRRKLCFGWLDEGTQPARTTRLPQNQRNSSPFGGDGGRQRPGLERKKKQTIRHCCRHRVELTKAGRGRGNTAAEGGTAERGHSSIMAFLLPFRCERQTTYVPFVSPDVRVGDVSGLANEVLQLRPAHALGQAGDADLVARAGGGAAGAGGAVSASSASSAVPTTTSSSTVPATPTPTPSAVATPLVRLFSREKARRNCRSIA